MMETFVRLFTACMRRARAFGSGRRLCATKISAIVVTIARNTQLIFLCFIFGSLRFLLPVLTAGLGVILLVG